MNKYSRVIKKIKPSGWTRTFDGKSYDLYLAVIGIFNTEKVHWTYYYGSFTDNTHGVMILTNDCTKSPYGQNNSSISSIEQCCNLVKTQEEGIKWCEDFKMKWDTGSNDLVSEVKSHPRHYPMGLLPRKR
jgi:hypothetical protein